jgi:hypothetical protein
VLGAWKISAHEPAACLIFSFCPIPVAFAPLTVAKHDLDHAVKLYSLMNGNIPSKTKTNPFRYEKKIWEEGTKKLD